MIRAFQKTNVTKIKRTFILTLFIQYIADNYSPPAPPKFETECPVDAGVTEIEDPTVEEEQAFKKAQEEELMAAEEMEEEDDEDEDD